MGQDRGQPSTQDGGGRQGEDALAETLSTFARSSDQLDPHDTLVEVVRAAVQLVPGCDEASIGVVLGRRKVTSEAASGDVPRAVDAVQERLQQGPCLDAAYQHATVRVSDMATETRWPLFAPRGTGRGRGRDAVDPALRRGRRPRRPEPVLATGRRACWARTLCRVARPSPRSRSGPAARAG